MDEKILVVDDEQEIAELVQFYLENEGFSVVLAFNASDALNIINQNEINFAILDIMLPDMSGLNLCKKIREQHMFPIIMLTAKINDMDKINGLTVGADDYITKPFNPLELVARVKTQLRRYIQYNTVKKDLTLQYNFNGLYICKDTHKCELYGKELSLTRLEFDILWYLCERRGSVVPLEVLFEAVWKEKYFDSNNTVMAHIARLREKMGEKPRKPKFIKTVWGVGYKID
ncbi:MAG: VanR-ABDEGLN family response regulator transcription factor [Eubacterium sp.]|nr:VanR-ABDEGLN family response regulator transcription factor [Eubacterium sp.]